jgi:protein-S-isoprenylcysteine O-methyltransferase Ste14
MNRPVLLLCLLGYALLGSLPLTFFRRGRFNVAWFATAAPFFAAATLVAGAVVGVVAPVQLPVVLQEALACVAVVLLAGALLLIGCAVGVHRAPVSLWHQDEDTPAALITCGPYARMRHPFYSAFIMMLIGTAAALPHASTAALVVLATLQLQRTARREERRILVSAHGAAYAAYMGKTGRFLPQMLPGKDARERFRSRAREAQPIP